jgi:signal peptidase I
MLANAMQNVSHLSTSRSTLADWAFNITVLLFVTSTIAQPFVIPTGSMETTLMTGDHLIVDKLAYAPHGALAGRVLPYTDVKRGDIIVFRWPVDISQNYVKRVIGVPGDRVRLEDKNVYRNGIKLFEPYVKHIDSRRIPYRDDFPSTVVPLEVYPRGRLMLSENVRTNEVVVPEGQYFAMGDNRDDSSDSRFWGLMPRENIIGKPVIVYWSYAATTEELTGYSAHHFFDVATHFFTRTRWDRMFKLVRAGQSN